ncbi:hypothetical protein [Pseudomonas sp. NPDC088444]|uniref:hypothetical protein n=1 Tax=Pseudomonas sp. NPDC088444 TaxID=3364456 RepID=UPI00384EC23F
MNIIDLIDNNLFLKKLYPNGLSEQVFIGQFGLDVEGRFYLNIHTRQSPQFKIEKWGEQGRDYDVIVIKLIGTYLTEFSTKNWFNVSYAPLHASSNSNTISLASTEANWEFHATFKSLSFQSCSTYCEL